MLTAEVVGFALTAATVAVSCTLWIVHRIDAAAERMSHRIDDVEDRVVRHETRIALVERDLTRLVPSGATH